MTDALQTVLPLLESLVALGVPGVLLLVAAIPAVVIIVVCFLDHRHGKRVEALLEAYRTDTQKILRESKADTEESVQKMAAKHAEMAEFYRKNVTLVKNYERMTDSLQQLVVNNTRAMEHLITIIERDRRM